MSCSEAEEQEPNPDVAVFFPSGVPDLFDNLSVLCHYHAFLSLFASVLGGLGEYLCNSSDLQLCASFLDQERNDARLMLLILKVEPLRFPRSYHYVHKAESALWEEVSGVYLFFGADDAVCSRLP